MFTFNLNANEFKKYMKMHKITQSDLAETIGVDRSYISQIINGRSISKLCAYAFCKAISPELEISSIFKIKK